MALVNCRVTTLKDGSTALTAKTKDGEQTNLLISRDSGRTPNRDSQQMAGTCTDYWRSEQGCQVTDATYATTYRVSHCNAQPTSPDVHVTEFPPQRASLVPGEGNFVVGHNRYTYNETEFCRGPVNWPDKGSLNTTRAAKQLDSFANSLRKYPQDQEASAELLERVITYISPRSKSPVRSPKSSLSPTPQQNRNAFGGRCKSANARCSSKESSFSRQCHDGDSRPRCDTSQDLDFHFNYMDSKKPERFNSHAFSNMQDIRYLTENLRSRFESPMEPNHRLYNRMNHYNAVDTQTQAAVPMISRQTGTFPRFTASHQNQQNVLRTNSLNFEVHLMTKTRQLQQYINVKLCLKKSWSSTSSKKPQYLRDTKSFENVSVKQELIDSIYRNNAVWLVKCPTSNLSKKSKIVKNSKSLKSSTRKIEDFHADNCPEEIAVNLMHELIIHSDVIDQNIKKGLLLKLCKRLKHIIINKEEYLSKGNLKYELVKLLHELPLKVKEKYVKLEYINSLGDKLIPKIIFLNMKKTDQENSSQKQIIDTNNIEKDQQVTSKCNSLPSETKTFVVLQSIENRDTVLHDTTDFSIGGIEQTDIDANLKFYGDQLQTEICQWLAQMVAEARTRHVVAEKLIADIIEALKSSELNVSDDEVNTRLYIKIKSWIENHFGSNNQISDNQITELLHIIRRIPMPMLQHPGSYDPAQEYVQQTSPMVQNTDVACQDAYNRCSTCVQCCGRDTRDKGTQLNLGACTTPNCPQNSFASNINNPPPVFDYNGPVNNQNTVISGQQLPNNNANQWKTISLSTTVDSQPTNVNQQWKTISMASNADSLPTNVNQQWKTISMASNADSQPTNNLQWKTISLASNADSQPTNNNIGSVNNTLPQNASAQPMRSNSPRASILGTNRNRSASRPRRISIQLGNGNDTLTTRAQSTNNTNPQVTGSQPTNNSRAQALNNTIQSVNDGNDPRNLSRPYTENAAVSTNNQGPNIPRNYAAVVDEIDDLFMQYFTQWLQQIPIQATNTRQQELADQARQGIANAYVASLRALNLDAKKLNRDRKYYEDILDDVLENLLNQLPQSPEMLQMKPVLKSKLIEETISAYRNLFNVPGVITYRILLNASVMRAMPHSRNRSHTKYMMTILQLIADNYLMHVGNTVLGDEEIAEVYLQNCLDLIYKLFKFKSLHGYESNHDELRNNILSYLNDISIPNPTALMNELDFVNILRIVQNWSNYIMPQHTFDIEKASVIRANEEILGERIYHIDKLLNLNDLAGTKAITGETIRFLEHVPYYGNIDIGEAVNYLQKMIKNRIRYANLSQTNENEDIRRRGLLLAPYDMNSSLPGNLIRQHIQMYDSDTPIYPADHVGPDESYSRFAENVPKSSSMDRIMQVNINRPQFDNTYLSRTPQNSIQSDDGQFASPMQNLPFYRPDNASVSPQSQQTNRFTSATPIPYEIGPIPPSQPEGVPRKSRILVTPPLSPEFSAFPPSSLPRDTLNQDMTRNQNRSSGISGFSPIKHIQPIHNGIHTGQVAEPLNLHRTTPMQSSGPKTVKRQGGLHTSQVAGPSRSPSSQYPNSNLLDQPMRNINKRNQNADNSFSLPQTAGHSSRGTYQNQPLIPKPTQEWMGPDSRYGSPAPYNSLSKDIQKNYTPDLQEIPFNNTMQSVNARARNQSLSTALPQNQTASLYNPQTPESQYVSLMEDSQPHTMDYISMLDTTHKSGQRNLQQPTLNSTVDNTFNSNVPMVPRNNHTPRGNNSVRAGPNHMLIPHGQNLNLSKSSSFLDRNRKNDTTYRTVGKPKPYKTEDSYARDDRGFEDCICAEIFQQMERYFHSFFHCDFDCPFYYSFDPCYY